MPSWNCKRLRQTEKEGGWWQVSFLILDRITLVQQDKPTVRSTGSRTPALIQHSVFLQYRSDVSNKDISINARKQSSVVFYSRPKAVCSQGETFQILTDSGVSLYLKALAEDNEKRAEEWSSKCEGRIPGFLPALLGSWVSYILPKGKKIDDIREPHNCVSWKNTCFN